MAISRIVTGLLLVGMACPMTWLGCRKSFVIKDEHLTHADGPNWPEFGGSAARLNHREQTLPPPLALKWTYKATSAIGPSLVTVDGLAYVITLDGRLDIVAVATGDRIGRIKLKDGFEATCTYSDGALYVAYRYGDDTLFKYDLATGKNTWEIDAGDIASEPLVADGGLYVSALYRHIDKYDPASGELIWSYKTKGQHRSSPSFADNTIVVGSDNGIVYALDAADGSLKWQTQVGASVQASPVIDDGKVYIGSVDSVFYAFSLERGTELWSFHANSPLFQSAATDGKKVCFGGTDGQFYALDAGSGRLLWQFSATSVISTSPAISGDVIYFGSLDKKYYCLNLADGSELWSFTTRGRIRTSPVVWGNTLLGASDDRYLYAFSNSTGPR